MPANSVLPGFTTVTRALYLFTGAGQSGILIFIFFFFFFSLNFCCCNFSFFSFHLVFYLVPCASYTSEPTLRDAYVDAGEYVSIPEEAFEKEASFVELTRVRKRCESAAG